MLQLFSPSTTSTGSNVVNAAALFAGRKCPIGAEVSHPLHGFGTVVDAFDLSRTVEFEKPEVHVEAMPILDEEGNDITVSVRYLPLEAEVVHVSTLHELVRNGNRFKRWNSRR